MNYNERIVHTLRQPVVLLGAPGCGKTSLLHWWNASWSDPSLSAPAGPIVPRTTDVTVFYSHDWTRDQRSNDGSLIPYHVHLMFKVFDHPGEPSVREQFKKEALQDVVVLQNQLKLIGDPALNAGIVFICFLDCDALNIEKTMNVHRECYAGVAAMFRDSEIAGIVDKVIIVLNKFDKVPRILKELTPTEKRDRCIAEFRNQGILGGVARGVSTEKIRIVPTILADVDGWPGIIGTEVVKKIAASTLIGDKALL